MNCGFQMVNEMIVDALRESNAIEEVYDDQSLVQAIKAWEFVMKHSVITPDVVRKTHGILMKHQTLKKHEKGAYRTIPVYIAGHEAMDYKEIEDAVASWCSVMSTPIDINPDDMETLMREHHVEYEGIHPFVDGNGRTGRIFMNWERVRRGFLPMVIWENERHKYYAWFLS